MPEKRHNVLLLADSGESSQGVFLVNEDADRQGHRFLSLQYSGGKFSAEASDYFAALCIIRNDLENTRWRPFCYGSSRNVYPSGMCRDMGRGLVAYRMLMGKAPDIATDVVSIFDNGSDVTPVSVNEQRQFFEDWLRSRGINPR